jgi:HSP20 family protein
MPLAAAGEQQFSNVVRQMGKMMDQMQKGYFNFFPAETWTPAVNLYENDIGYIVCVDLSGVDKEKIDLVVAEGQLKLRGQRAVPTTPEGGEGRAKGMRVHLMEIDYGPFCREVALPADVDQEKIRATYLNGMLFVELPRK